MSVVEGETAVVEKWSPVVSIVVANVAVGSVNALVKKALDGGTNHMVIGAYRMTISAFILAPLAYFLERKVRPKITFRLMIDHFISGLLGASLLQFFFMLGLYYTSATVSCALLSMLPAITFTLSLILRVESISDIKSKAGMLKVMGTLICISGALLLTFYKGPQISKFHDSPEALHHHNNNGQDKTKNWVFGCICATIGAVFLSIWMLFQGTLNIKYPCKYSSTCLMSVFAAFQCALLSLYKRRDVNDWVIHDRFVIFVIVYIGIVGQAMTTVATTWSIKKVGAVFASTFSPIILISATLFDFLILHSPVYLGSIIGAVVAVVGLYVFLLGKNKQTEAAAKLCPRNQNEDKNNNSSINNDGSRLSV
ncbi:WAT1-related protein [Cardamine amara subsp. amara]|uniref:WAT1-related protein n=1 Tax=Cardamine amara subsp. amara TaxID=228776 RepID=A0ABD1BU34_CARAN